MDAFGTIIVSFDYTENYSIISEACRSRGIKGSVSNENLLKKFDGTVY